MATKDHEEEYKTSYWEEVLQQTLTEDLKLFLSNRIETLDPPDHFAILEWEQGQMACYPYAFM